jgi:DNA primase
MNENAVDKASRWACPGAYKVYWRPLSVLELAAFTVPFRGNDGSVTRTSGLGSLVRSLATGDRATRGKPRLVRCSGIDRKSLQEAKRRVSLFELVRHHVRSYRPSGTDRYMCLCPFHEERSASLLVDNQRGFYRCFGCGARGDAIRFLMDLKQVDFRTAAAELLSYANGHVHIERASIPEGTVQERRVASIPPQLECVSFDECMAHEDFSVQSAEQERVLRLNTLALGFFRQQLGRLRLQSTSTCTEARDVLRYLHETRSLTVDTVDAFCIGYAPLQWRALVHYMLYEQTEVPVTAEDLILAGLAKTRVSTEKTNNPNRSGFEKSLYDVFRGRLMIPIRDADGRVVGFGGRRLAFTERTDTDPKPPERFAGNGVLAKYPNEQSTSWLASRSHTAPQTTTSSREIEDHPSPSSSEPGYTSIDDETARGPKYLNTPETPAFHKSRILFGMMEVMQRIRTPEAFPSDWCTVAEVGPCVVLVEGYLDVLRLHQEGIWFAVAALGTSVTSSHCQTLARLAVVIGQTCAQRSLHHRRPRIILQLDQDDAGTRATKRVLQVFFDQLNASKHQTSYDLCVANLPTDVKDADEFVQLYGGRAYLMEVVNRASIWWQREITDHLNAYIAAVKASRKGIPPERDVTRLFWRWSPALKACIQDIADSIRRAHLFGADQESLLTMVANEIGKLYVPLQGRDDPSRDIAEDLRASIRQQPAQTCPPYAMLPGTGALSMTNDAEKSRPYPRISSAALWRDHRRNVPLTTMPAPFNSYPPWIRAELKLLRVLVCATEEQREAWQQRLLKDSTPLLALITMPAVRRAIAYLLGLDSSPDGVTIQAGPVCPFEDVIQVAVALWQCRAIQELDMANIDAEHDECHGPPREGRQQLGRNERDPSPQEVPRALDCYLIPKEIFGPIAPQASAAATGPFSVVPTSDKTEQPEHTSEAFSGARPQFQDIDSTSIQRDIAPSSVSVHKEHNGVAVFVPERSTQAPRNGVVEAVPEHSSGMPAASQEKQLPPLLVSESPEGSNTSESTDEFLEDLCLEDCSRHNVLRTVIQSIGVRAVKRTNRSGSALLQGEILSSGASATDPPLSEPLKKILEQLHPRSGYREHHNQAVAMWLYVDRRGADDEFSTQVARLQYLRCQVQLALTWQSWSAAAAGLLKEIAQQKALKGRGGPAAALRAAASLPYPTHPSVWAGNGATAHKSRASSLRAAIAHLDTDLGRRCQAYLDKIHAISEEMIRLEKFWQSEGKLLLNALRRDD